MYSVKATVIGFLGDEKKYPCHFDHKIGDEVIFDGEKCVGRVCPAALEKLVPKVVAMMNAGPKYVDPMQYAAFVLAPPNKRDPEMKVYDGFGFRLIKDSTGWQQHSADTQVTVICPDSRTSAVIKLEAFDICSLGYALPYYRKQMLILNVVKQKRKIELSKIRDNFSSKQLNEVYPGLSPTLLQVLVDELLLVGHLTLKNGKLALTQKGIKKLEDFKLNLSALEIKALGV